MNQPQHPNPKLLQFMMRAQQIARSDVRLLSPANRSDRGYAMMMTSLLSVFIFSILGAYMTVTNLSQLSTNAYIDGTNTFYVAESGLNKRAQELRQRFIEQITPSSGSTVAPSQISDCFPILTTAPVTANDFECRNYAFRYSNSTFKVTNDSLATDASKQNLGGAATATEQNKTVDYYAYTFVRPNQNYAAIAPTPQRIPAGQVYAGLNALEYKYTVYATAAKPNSSNGVLASDAKTVLQMDFKSRIVPLFQFAAFYEDDLEMTSQMPMVVSGPVHTNSDLRAISYGYNNGGDPSHNTSASVVSADLMAGTRLLGAVTVHGSIYERAQSDDWRPLVCASSQTRLTQTQNCGVMSVYIGSAADPSTDTNPANYAYFPDFVSQAVSGGRTTPLTAAELAPFGSKMMDGPNQQIPRLNPPKPGFLREKNYLTNEVGSYYGKADIRLKFYPGRAMPFDLTAIQAGGSGCTTAMNIAIDRQGRSTLACTVLNKGQLQSLRQPVVINLPSGMTTQNQNIVKALQVAIATAPTPVVLSELDTAIPSTAGTWGATFRTLLSNHSLPAPAAGQTANQLLTAIAPGSSCLPAPIQLVSGTTASADPNVNGGFWNQLDGLNTGALVTGNGNWMTMLQINIKSLTYWNRDGIYVPASDTILTTAYTPSGTPTVSSGVSTDNAAFVKASAILDVAGSFSSLGLAAADRTEGGLVFHASVSDDIDGDGTNDITAVSTDPVPGKDANGNAIAVVDYYRRYPGITGTKKSPYGFVVSGGVELPGPLTFATDQAAYIQGDYNNPGTDLPGTLPQTTAYRPSNDPLVDRGYRRQAAAIIADTITVLSNQCLNNNKQVNCGSSTALSSQTQVTNGIAINAAFLSNLMKSGTVAGTTNGGLNKYMRLLENWGGSTTGTYYNYTGSMVSLGEALESDKVANGAGVPQRNFNYETRFNSFDRLPPLTPSAMYLQQGGFKRKYHNNW